MVDNTQRKLFQGRIWNHEYLGWDESSHEKEVSASGLQAASTSSIDPIEARKFDCGETHKSIPTFTHTGFKWTNEILVAMYKQWLQHQIPIGLSYNHFPYLDDVIKVSYQIDETLNSRPHKKAFIERAPQASGILIARQLASHKLVVHHHLLLGLLEIIPLLDPKILKVPQRRVKDHNATLVRVMVIIKHNVQIVWLASPTNSLLRRKFMCHHNQ